MVNHMKSKDSLRLQQTEEAVRSFRPLIGAHSPRGGWVRAIREALGMTNVQLARQLKIKAPQSVEDMQEYEARGTIKLQTLRKLAEALGCRLVYAIVPAKPLDEVRRERARQVAARRLERAAHSMSLEAQGVSDSEEARELERQVEELLAGNPKRLWD